MTGVYSATRPRSFLYFAAVWLLLSLQPLDLTAAELWVVRNGDEDPELSARLVAGIRSAADEQGATTRIVALTDLEAQARTSTPQAVIAVGTQTLQALRARTFDARVLGLASATALSDARADGIVPLPHPKQIIRALRAIAPGVTRVHVVIQKDDEWWLRTATNIARASSVELVTHQALSEKDAALHYLNVFRYANPRTDALWVTDSVPREVLARIIEESWSRDFVVFSSVLDHVRAGALFSLYPDVNGLGRTLAKWALSGAATPDSPRIHFLEDVDTALNVRTATHLGLPTDVAAAEIRLRIGGS